MTILATACAGESTPAAVDAPEPIAALAPPSGPVVEVVPPRLTPPLDPNAAPTTPLGELRARYLPVWSPDFDWAFPPEVCGSAWALDAVAEPTTAAAAAALDDPVAAMALSVMRYEHLVSRAMARPDVSEQLCVAVSTVGATRAATLDVLASRLAEVTPADGPPAYPDEVTIIATSPTGALAVACVSPGYPALVTDDREATDDPNERARLAAYLLLVSRGLEDTVTDISFRVSEVTATTAEDCAELGAWADQWSQQAQEWADAGDIWTPADRTVTADEICGAPRADDRDDCPRDWAL